MIFQPTALAGAHIVELEKREDDRGFFARAFCAREFGQHGLKPAVVQANLSFTRRRGSIRGMHYQVPPATETKFVRCIRGAILDVLVDVRPGSPTYLQHIAVELTQDNRRAVYIPEMFAHGFQALTDDVEMLYLVSEFHAPGSERGLRFDDPRLGIHWPEPVTVVSNKDRAWPLL
jgi:dTDP-4-dehydrorhamnose 3,5-epimerase